MTSITIQTKNYLWRMALRYLVNPRKVVRIRGNTMHLDSKDSLLLSLRKNYEPKHVQLMQKVIRRGDHVVDVGAHIGYYTLLMAQLVGPEGKVFAFEPDPENFKILEKNVRKNGYSNVVLEHKAVSHVGGKAQLFLSKISKGDTRIYSTQKDQEREAESTYEVSTVCLDEYFKNELDRITFFKMDIQGVEPLAFQGMHKVLSSDTLTFTLEFSPELLRAAGFDPMEFLTLLDAKGYSLFDVDLGKRVPQSQFERFVAYYDRINYFTTLFCKKSN